MDIFEIIKQRHSVRKYLEKPIEETLRKQINEFVDGVNNDARVHFQMVYDEPKCFSSKLSHYGHFENVTNYLVVSGHLKDYENCGYYGEKIVLKLQELGLNTCWVALTHGKVEASLPKHQKLLMVISVGYGRSSGFKPKGKELSKLYKGESLPEWFLKGVESARLAPTAMNQQSFVFTLKNDEVHAKSLGGFYSKVDLGIVKYHFEIVTNKKVR